MAEAVAPIIGQRRTSRLATSRTGAWDKIARTSSQDMWFAASSAAVLGNRPTSRRRTPNTRSSPLARVRTQIAEPARGSTKSAGRVDAAIARTATSAAIRAPATKAGTRRTAPRWGRHAAPQGERGRHMGFMAAG